MNKDKLKEVAGELENASKMHAGQAKKIKSMLKMKKSGPFKMKYSPLSKRGMWYNIHDKKKRGDTSTDNRPSAEAWAENTK